MQDYINLVYSLFMFIIGTLFGSFFTLAIYRIPRKQDIIKTRSYCPTCKHKLGFFDCFPILSYVSTIGRCRYCKKPISIRYPLIEFASGMTFLLIYLFFGFSWQALILIICYIYLFLVIGVDIMKNKMTDEEKQKVSKLKSSLKKGAINADVIVAVLIFVIFFVSTIFAVRNFNTTLANYIRKSNALNICINNINDAKSKTIEDLTSTNGTVEFDKINYNYEIQVLPYIKDGNVQVDNAKIIISTVTYTINNKENSVSLKAIKVEDI